ncbi:MAG: hypothetical protein ACO3ZW_03725 [Opitutales bacterium]
MRKHPGLEEMENDAMVTGELPRMEGVLIDSIQPALGSDPEELTIVVNIPHITDQGMIHWEPIED